MVATSAEAGSVSTLHNEQSMSLKAKLEAIIYAAEEPVTIEQIVSVLQDEISVDLGSQSSEAPPSVDAIEGDEHQPEPHLVLTDAKQEAKQQRQRSQRPVPPTLRGPVPGPQIRPSPPQR